MTPKRTTKAQVIIGFCYNCVYTGIWVVCCAMAFDRHSFQGGSRGINGAPIIAPASTTLFWGGFMSLFCVAALFFLWRSWWREVKRL